MFTTDRGSIALIRKLSFSYIHILIVLLLITLLKVYGGVQVSYGGPMPQLTIQTGHSDRINAMAVSPDSRYLASAALDHLVKLWDLNLKRELRTFYGAKSFPQDLYFSPDGRLLMGTFLADSTRIWDVLNGKPVLKFKSGPGARFTPDNKYICSADYHKGFEYYDCQTGALVKTVHIPEGVEMVTFDMSADGKIIVASITDLHQYKSPVTRHLLVIDTDRDAVIRKFDLNGPVQYYLRISMDNNAALIFEGEGNSTVSRLLELNNGTTIREFGTGNFPLYLSSNDAILAMLNGYNTIKFINFKTGESLQTINNIGFCTTGIFSPDSKTFFYHDREVIKMWSFKDGTTEDMVGMGVAPKHISITSDGNILTAFMTNDMNKDQYMKIWNLKTGEKPQYLNDRNYVNSFNAKETPGRTFAMSEECDIVTLDQSNSWLQFLPAWTNPYLAQMGIRSSALSPDGKFFAAGYVKDSDAHTGCIKVFSTSTGALKYTIDTDWTVYEIYFSPDGRQIIANTYWNLDVLGGHPEYKSDVILILDSVSGRQLQAYNVGRNFGNTALSSDGRYLASGNYHNNLDIIDLTNGSKQTIMGSWDIDVVAFSPDGRYVVAGLGMWMNRIGNERIKVWDITAKKELTGFKSTEAGRQPGVKSLFFTPDGRFLFSGHTDGKIKIWTFPGGEEVATLLSFADDWVVSTPDGRFDASKGGMQYMYYVRGMDIIPLESLYEQYFTPNLLLQVMAGEVSAKPEVNLGQLLPAPKVMILNADQAVPDENGVVNIIVQAEDAGGGIDEICIYHNGKLVDGTQRGFKPTVVQGSREQKIFSLMLSDGENRIRVSAFNHQRTEANPQEFVLNWQAKKSSKPALYIFAVGINNYLNPKYSLNYAVKDAEGFVDALKSGAKKLFNKVNTTVLNDAEATRTGIESAVAKIQTQIKSEDVFIFYYAGHGVMSSGSAGDKPDFYIVPYDVTKMYEADDQLKVKAISAQQIGEISRLTKAQKQLFVLDACQSGGAMQSFASRGAAEEKAIAMLARSTGTYFIAASGTEQFASEVNELGHGVFTYSLIEAIKGTCKSQDGKVTVNLLKSCVEERVPELTQKFKGQPQFPTGYGFGQDFPIVIIKD